MELPGIWSWIEKSFEMLKCICSIAFNLGL